MIRFHYHDGQKSRVYYLESVCREKGKREIDKKIWMWSFLQYNKNQQSSLSTDLFFLRRIKE